MTQRIIFIIVEKRFPYNSFINIQIIVGDWIIALKNDIGTYVRHCILCLLTSCLNIKYYTRITLMYIYIYYMCVYIFVHHVFHNLPNWNNL